MTGATFQAEQPAVLSTELLLLAEDFGAGGTEDCALIARRLEALSQLAKCQEEELAQWRRLKDVQSHRAGGVQ